MRIKKLSFLLSLFILGFYFCFGAATAIPNRPAINSIANIIYDMTSPHEGIPQGVPKALNWAIHPRVGMGNNPKDFRAMIAWGQLYEAAEGNFATNTRVEIENIKAYLLSKSDRKWHLLQSSQKVEGAAYRENYQNDFNKPADIRYEPNGSISVKLDRGYNFHFWCANGRAEIDPDDIAGIFTTVRARSIVDDPQQTDDRNKAKYLLSMGADYWLSLTAPWRNWTTNSDIGIGKFKYVTTEWQAFNMTTLTPIEIIKNPPPLSNDAIAK